VNVTHAAAHPSASTATSWVGSERGESATHDPETCKKCSAPGDALEFSRTNAEAGGNAGTDSKAAERRALSREVVAGSSAEPFAAPQGAEQRKSPPAGAVMLSDTQHNTERKSTVRV
jgi:hypothetical protein